MDENHSRNFHTRNCRMMKPLQKLLEDQWHDIHKIMMHTRNCCMSGQCFLRDLNSLHLYSLLHKHNCWLHTLQTCVAWMVKPDTAETSAKSEFPTLSLTKIRNAWYYGRSRGNAQMQQIPTTKKGLDRRLLLIWQSSVEHTSKERYTL